MCFFLKQQAFDFLNAYVCFLKLQAFIILFLKLRLAYLFF